MTPREKADIIRRNIQIRWDKRAKEPWPASQWSHDVGFLLKQVKVERARYEALQALYDLCESELKDACAKLEEKGT